GHANHQACADSYQHDLVDGMALDPSPPAPVCVECILGKQDGNSIPSIREDPESKATCRLGKIFVDLSGQMSVRSRSRNEYILDIVNDFSSRG
ncbi:hypothetical protein B0H13DRAFT_1465428, partial [Mycena leptocephala]